MTRKKVLPPSLLKMCKQTLEAKIARLQADLAARKSVVEGLQMALEHVRDALEAEEKAALPKPRPRIVTTPER